MPKERILLKLSFENEVIGFLENPKTDLWFRLGKWLPLDKKATEKFLKAIERDGEARVLLDGEEGLVVNLPNQEINVMMWPEILEE